MNQIETFSQACKTWLQTSLASIRSLPQFPGYEDFDATFSPDGCYSTTPSEIKIHFDTLFKSIHLVLFGSPEFETLVQLILTVPDLSKAFLDSANQASIETSIQRSILEQIFKVFLIEYAQANSTFTFTTDEFEHVFKKLEAYFIKEVPYIATTLMHLRNVRSSVDEFSIGKGIFIRPTTYEEKKEAVKRNLQNHSQQDIPEAFLCIQNRIIPKNRNLGPTNAEDHDIANAVIFALRLIKHDHVELGITHWNTAEQPFQISGGIGWSLIQSIHSYDNASYILNSEDIETLTKLWPQARKVYNKSDLLIARTRFEGSYVRNSLEDMLIDYWIGLEALFFPPDKILQMSESIALTISYYLGQTADERNAIYRQVNESHALRGKVVHGKPIEGKKLREMTTKTCDLLRRSLRKRIEE